MTFKSILVYRDRGTSAKVQLALAGKLAEDHNAQIVSLAVRQTQIYPMGFVEMIPQDVINSISAQTEEAIDELCKSFRVTRALHSEGEICYFRNTVSFVKVYQITID